MIGTEERLSPRPARAPALDLALGVAVFAGTLVSLLHLRIHPQRFPLDLDVYREAGRYALHHRDPYSPGFGDSLRIKLPFTYPPFAAFVFAPLALVPKSAVLAGWTALCIGLFGIILHLTVRPALLARGWSHPAVLAAAVVAMPDEKWGETPCAFVETRPDAQLTDKEIIEFCRRHLASFKAPRAVVFGELPKTSTGKIQKFVLREKAKSATVIET